MRRLKRSRLAGCRTRDTPSPKLALAISRLRTSSVCVRRYWLIWEGVSQQTAKFQPQASGKANFMRLNYDTTALPDTVSSCQRHTSLSRL